MVLLHPLQERSIGEVLNLGIDAEHDVLARPRRFEPSDALDDSAEVVAQHPFRPRTAGQALFECEFDAFLSVFIHAGESDDVTRRLPERVVAAVFAPESDTGYVECAHALRERGRDLTAKVEELLAGAGGNAFPELGRRHFEQLRQSLEVVSRLEKAARIRPDREDRSAYRERSPVAIEDLAAMSGDGCFAQMPRFALLLQESALVQIEVHRPPHQGHCSRAHHRRRKVAASWRARASRRAELVHPAGPQGITSTMSAAAGTSSASRSRAMCSMRPRAAHTLRSSNRRPHSSSIVSRSY